ncbi:TPA: prephenate dehydratase [Streptococcus suis]
MKIGFQGIPGSYSEAAVQYFLNHQPELASTSVDLLSYDHFNPLMADLAQGKMDFAVFPVENSTTGIITRTMDLFKYQPVLAVGQVYQAIQHHLLALPGIPIESLREVYSHPEALSQSQEFFLQFPWLIQRPYSDTAMSAKKVALEGDPKQAALASKRAGDLYGLSSLAGNIQNQKSNQTRFLLVKHKNKMTWDQVQSSHLMLYVETPHEPGALLKLLQVFEVFHCNLEALNARPIPDQPFIYGFFIQIDISQMIGQAHALGTLVANQTTYHQIIGDFAPTKTII